MLKINITNTLCHQVATYTSGSQLEWREVEGGQLPSPRWGLRATLVDNVIFVTGGQIDAAYGDGDEEDDYDDNDYGVDYDGQFKKILSWDPLTESWQQAGTLKVGRYGHAAVAIASSIIECSGRDVKEDHTYVPRKQLNQ